MAPSCADGACNVSECLDEDEGSDEDPPDEGGEEGDEEDCEDVGCEKDEYCGDDGECADLGENLCDPVFDCVEQCADDKGDRCGQACIRDQAIDHRLRTLSSLACSAECDDDGWCTEHLCQDEALGCFEGVEPVEPDCTAMIFCHFTCAGDPDCHSWCIEESEEVAEDLAPWFECASDLCQGDGEECDIEACKEHQIACQRSGFRTRCELWCEEELIGCVEGIVDGCQELCGMPAWRASVGLACILDDDVADRCDAAVLPKCVAEAEEATKDDPDPEPDPDPDGGLRHESILFEAFDRGPAEGWTPSGSSWDHDGVAELTDCDRCPDGVPYLQLDRDLPTRSGYARLSFSAKLPRPEDPQGAWVALHARTEGRMGQRQLARRIGIGVSTTAAGLVVWTGMEGAAGLTHRLAGPLPADQWFTFKLSCYGGAGFEVYAARSGLSERPMVSAFFHDPCRLPGDPDELALMLGGRVGAQIDNVRYELLPCDSDNPSSLWEGGGDCGRVASWPFENDLHEHVQGGAPEAASAPTAAPEDFGGRNAVFLTADSAAGLHCSRPPGADSAGWTIDMWATASDIGGRLQPRMLWDDAAREGEGLPSGRSMSLNENNQLVCESFGDGPLLVAIESRQLAGDTWARLSCTYEAGTLTARADDQFASTTDDDHVYIPSQADIRIGAQRGPAGGGIRPLRGFISEARLHEIAKRDPYFDL